MNSNLAKLELLYGKVNNSNVSRFDRYLSKRYFILNENYEIVLDKQNCKCIRLYDSEDDYDINLAPKGAYYDNNENVWCIDIDEDEFNSFDHTNEKYEYYKRIFYGEIPKYQDIKHILGKHLY